MDHVLLDESNYDSTWELNNESDDASKDVEKCGCEVRCGCFRTKRRTFGYLTLFNNPKGALFFLCLASFLQGAVINGFYNINVSTLEKRFALRSSETGFISSAYDIAGCLAIPIFTYIGGTGHKPLWIGSGVFIMGLGSILFSLPHFIAPTYSVLDAAGYDCDTHTSCGETSLRTFRGFFILGHMLLGVGSTPLYTLALSYLDENVDQVRSSTYHGIFYAASYLGPGVGYILGGYMLTHFTTLEDPSEITPESPLWIGNWWLGFLVVGVLFIFLSFPLLTFPEGMPETAQFRLNRESEMHQHEEALEVQRDEHFGKSIKDAPRCLLVLLKNPTVMIISLANALDSGMMIGLATFGPKYIESMFSLSASTAAFYFGVLAIATACSAHLLCGYLISKLKLTVHHMLRMSVACAITAFSCLFIFLRSCENPDIAGVFVPYPGESEISCKQTKCGCSTELYRPVCGSDNLTYLSFCDAECEISGSETFGNCARIANSSATARVGPCVHDSCPNFGMFIAFMGLAVFFTFMKGQTTLQSSLRAVPFTQRAFTLGVQWLVIRLIGSIPLPIIYGKILDMSCVLWEMHCDECGSCHVYDNQAMATSMTWLNLSLKSVNVALLIAVNFFYKPPPSEDTNSDMSLIGERRVQLDPIPRPII